MDGNHIAEIKINLNQGKKPLKIKKTKNKNKLRQALRAGESGCEGVRRKGKEVLKIHGRGPGLVAQLVRASSQYANVAGSSSARAQTRLNQ